MYQTIKFPAANLLKISFSLLVQTIKQLVYDSYCIDITYMLLSCL